jgi:AraC-like DNA-binding protein
VLLKRSPAPVLRGRVTAYHGWEERTVRPIRRREGPGREIVVIFSFDHGWLIDGERRRSFVGGLHRRQVTTEHAGYAHGLQVGLEPWAAHALLCVPLHELAETTVPLDEVLDAELVERLETARGWDERFALLDAELGRRLADARPASPEVAWAWERLCERHGNVPVGSLSAELGWSRKRLAARFRDEIGLAPKAAARLLRFERARALAGSMSWAELAYVCGFADQPHLIAEFRAFTGRTPETFLQDEAGVGP